MSRARAGSRGRRGRAGGVRPLPHRSSVHASVAPGGGRRMSEVSYQYVVLRCVPRVEREEFVNVGVVLHCQATEFLGVAWHVDRERSEEHTSELQSLMRISYAVFCLK